VRIIETKQKTVICPRRTDLRNLLRSHLILDLALLKSGLFGQRRGAIHTFRFRSGEIFSLGSIDAEPKHRPSPVIGVLVGRSIDDESPRRGVLEGTGRPPRHFFLRGSFVRLPPFGIGYKLVGK